MLGPRILVAIVGIPLLLLPAYAGGGYFLALIAILSFLGLREYYHLLKHMGLNPPMAWGQLGGLGLLVTVYLRQEFPPFLPQFLLFLFLLGFLLTFPRYSLAEAATSFLGVLYVAGSFSYLLLLRLIPGWGFSLLLFTLLLVWANDTAAYFAGKIWGRSKLCPILSPGKTWEGALGGLAGTLIVGVLIGSRLLPQGQLLLLILSLLVALAGQAGDLIESGIKRLAQVKDSGRFLPGHGGILDRFDSLFLVGPVVYYFWIFVS